MTGKEALGVIEDELPFIDGEELAEALEVALEALKEQRPHGEWIPCSERLPHAEYGESDSVLCQLENDTMKVLYWDGGNWCHPTGELYHSVNHKNGWHNRVIAWMPLPEPYKEEGEAE